MKIRRLDIEAFGSLDKMTLGDIPPCLAVFLGKNEAGKSTLLAFIRTMFFGFPDRRTNQPSYEPPDLKPYGGRLELETSSGQWLFIERIRVSHGSKAWRTRTRIFDKQGREFSESYLQGIFGGVNRLLYENVFAFGLGELQALESLSQSGVKDAIYGAGFGTAFLAVPKAQKELSTALNSLFRPAGKKQKINRLLSKLREVSMRLAHAKATMDNYLEAQKSVTEAERQVESIKTALEEVDKELEKAADLLGAWEDFQQMQELTAQIKPLEERVGQLNVPEEKIRYCQDVQKELELLDRAFAQKKKDLEEAEKELYAISLNDSILKKAQEIRGLFSKSQHILALKGELETERQRIRDFERNLASILKSLGPDWDRERLQKISISLEAKEELKLLGKELELLKQSLTGLEEGLAIRRKDLSKTSVKLDKVLKEVEELKVSVGEVDREGLALLVSLLEDVKRDFKELSQLNGEIEQLETRVSRQLKDASLKISSERLGTLDFSSFETRARQIKKSLAEIYNDMKSLEGALIQLETRQRVLVEGIGQRQKRLNEIEKELSSLGGDVSKLIVSGKSISATYPQKFQIEDLLNSLKKREQKYRVEIRHLILKRRFFKGLSGLFYISPIALILCGGLYFSLNKTLSYEEWTYLLLVMLPVSILSFVAGRFLGGISVRQEKSISSLEKELSDTKAKIDELTQVLAGLEADVASVFQALGLGQTDDIEENIKKAVEKIFYLEILFKKKALLDEEKSSLSRELDSVERAREELEGKIRALGENEAAILKKWKTFLESEGFGGDLQPEDLEGLLIVIAELKSTLTKIQDKKAKKKILEEQREKRLEELMRKLSLKGSGEMTQEGSIKEIEQKIAFLKDTFDNLDDRKRQLQELSERLGAQQAEIDALEERQNELVKKRHFLQQELGDLLGTIGLKRNLAPGTALEMFSAIQRARDYMEDLEIERKRAGETEEKVSAYLKAVNELLEEVALSDLFDADTFWAIERLFSILEEEEKKARRKEGLFQKRNDLVKELEELDLQIQKRKKALKKIFSKYGADSVETFLNVIEEQKKLQGLREKIDKLLFRISLKTGIKDLKEIEEAFSTRSHAELQAQVRELQLKHDALEQELHSLYALMAQFRHEMKTLETSSSLEDNLQEYHLVRERLREEARNWTVLKFEEYLLNKARERFEAENRPKVLEMATEHFSAITGGKYTMVLPSQDGKGFLVMDREGRRKDVSRLSRGTAEQLYLSLRFGVMSICEPEGESIPAIMDDILVNFDPERMERAAGAISNLSKERQVLFFTCHPNVAETLARQKCETQVIELDAP